MRSLDEKHRCFSFHVLGSHGISLQHVHVSYCSLKSMHRLFIQLVVAYFRKGPAHSPARGLYEPQDKYETKFAWMCFRDSLTHSKGVLGALRTTVVYWGSHVFPMHK